MSTLDARISTALRAEDTDREAFMTLWREAFDSITAAKETVETESANLLDIENPDPDASDDKVIKAQRAIDRLTIAIRRLKERVLELDAAAAEDAWQAEADKLEGLRDKLAQELAELYPSFVENVADLFARIDVNTAMIRNLNARAPSVRWGDKQRCLIDAELKARNLDRYSAAQPPLRDKLKLPDWTEPAAIAFPVQVINQMYAASAGALAAMNAKFAVTCNADWAAAKAIENEQRRAEHAEREAKLAAEEAAKKAKYEQSLLAADRRKQRGLNGG